MNTRYLIKRLRTFAQLRDKTTKGPWVRHDCDVVTSKGCIIPICNVLRVSVAGADGRHNIYEVERAANAELIAAAPEMAELLESAANTIEQLAERLSELQLHGDRVHGMLLRYAEHTWPSYEVPLPGWDTYKNGTWFPSYNAFTGKWIVYVDTGCRNPWHVYGPEDEVKRLVEMLNRHGIDYLRATLG